MKKLGGDYGQGLTLLPESQDDLWSLSQILDVGDMISGRTLRKVKTGTQEDRNQKATKKPVWLKIKVEKIELGESLRVLGSVVEGPEDIAHGEHHSFILEPRTEFKLEKPQFLSYQKQKLEEALEAKHAPILIIVHDREEAFLAVLRSSGYEILAHLEGKVAKKGMDEGQIKNFYEEILAKVEEVRSRLEVSQVILASPAFWKEELMKLASADLKKKVVLATCSSVDKNAIDEVLKREEVKTALSADRTAKELVLVETLLSEISASGKAAYGEQAVADAVNAGAVETLLITDGFIIEKRALNAFQTIETILKTADNQKAQIHMISSQHDGGKKLDGLGGVAALLRYNLNH